MANSFFYNEGLLGIADRSIDYIGGTVEWIILSPTYTFDKTHKFVGDLTNEVTNATGTGYSRKAVAGKAIALVGDTVELQASNPSYDNIDTNEDLAYAVAYLKVTDDTDSRLICMTTAVDGNGDPAPLSTNGSNVELQVNTNGIGRFNNVLV